MSKRKRGEKEQGVGEERHKKIRVQEVEEHKAPLTENGDQDKAHTTVSSRKKLGDDASARKEARKKAKRERRHLKKLQNSPIHAPSVVLEHTQQSKAPLGSTKAERNINQCKVDDKLSRNTSKKGFVGMIRDGERKGSRLARGPKWITSGPIGGQMLNLDPLFALDEQHLLVAYGTSIAVYSTSTSLLVRRLVIPKAGIITGLALDPSNQTQIYVTGISGLIERWNWKEGQRSNVWQISSKIYLLAAAYQSWDEVRNDLLYTVDRKEGSQWLLSAHRLAGEDEDSRTEVKTLLKFDTRLSSFKVLKSGRVVVAISEQKIIIGLSESPIPTKLSEVKYVWRVVDCPEWIASFDVRSRASERTSQKHVNKGGILEAIDVVVGGLKGAIHIYEDLLQKLIRKEKAGKISNLEEIASRSLHWHRNAVLTVKWSLDGNYIISGGQETVLVLWQLETGHRQDLPHLGAPVESIVVSPAGSSYSVRLADNSAMILSTSELRPTFSIAGSLVPAASRQQRSLPFVPTVDAPFEQAAGSRRNPYPACVACPGTDRLLLAVPPSNVSNQTSTASLNASYLQTCDLSSGHQLSRQALTRTKITTLNMGPEFNTIEEPDVTQMQVSHDGHWLATIDEWTPPKRDLASLTFDDEESTREQIARQEIYLKFWSWNKNEQVWELVSRIDNPHGSDFGKPYDSGRVLGLVSNPSASSFSTIGEEGVVKTWVPAARMRRELKVRGKDGKTLTTWRCQYTISTGSSFVDSSVAGLAYSPDGSLLTVVPLASSSPSAIYLIDAVTGTVKGTHTGLSSGPIFGVGIISKYLIILSYELLIWDLVNNVLHYGIDLHLQSLPRKLPATSILAVNHKHRSFAITIPDVTKDGRVRTKVAVMNPDDPQPYFDTTIQSTVTNLLPAKSKKGFYAIDSNSEIQSFMPQNSIVSDFPTPPRDTARPTPGIDGIFGDSKIDDGTGSKPTGLLTVGKDIIMTGGPGREEHDKVVVSQDRLAAVFDTGSAMSMPPVTELFQRVAKLYDGRSEA